jgi:hypothetical protein
MEFFEERRESHSYTGVSGPAQTAGHQKHLTSIGNTWQASVPAEAEGLTYTLQSEYFCSLKFICWDLTNHGMALEGGACGRSLNHDAVLSWIGILYKECLLVPSTMRGHSKKVPSTNQKIGLHETPNPPEPQGSEGWILVHPLPPSLRYFVVTAQSHQDTLKLCLLGMTFDEITLWFLKMSLCGRFDLVSYQCPRKQTCMGLQVGWQQEGAPAEHSGCDSVQTQLTGRHSLPEHVWSEGRRRHQSPFPERDVF